MTSIPSGRDLLRAGVRLPSFPSTCLVLTLLVANGPALAQSAASSPTLPPVMVTATRFPDDAAKLAYGVSIITADQIRESGSATVNEALMKLLGIPGRADGYGGGNYTLDLRGFGTTADSNQVVILDGIRMNEGDQAATGLAGIPIDSVERIEVMRGSGTVLYGEGATAGAIVITTKARGAARPDQGNASVTLGSHWLVDTRADATVSAGGFSLDVAGSVRDTDNYRDNFHANTKATTATGQWRNDWLRIGTTQSYDRLETGLPGSLTAAQYAADPSQTNTPNDSAVIRNQRSSVFAQADVGNWQFGLDAGWRDKMLRSVYSFGSSAYDVEAQNLGLRARNQQAFGGMTNSVITGVDLDDWQRDVLGAALQQDNQKTRGLYIKDDFTFASGTRVSVGWRRESVEKDSSKANVINLDETLNAWELGVTQPVAANTSVYGRIADSFRLGNLDDFTFTSPGTTLRPQTSHDYELGGRWASAGSRVELRVYRSDLTDEIGYDLAAPGPFGSGANVNFDPTRRQGIELEMSSSITSTLTVGAVAARRQARFEGGPYTGNDVPLTPKGTLALQAGWKPWQNQQVDAYLNWVSSQYATLSNACAMPSYTTLDLRYAFRQPGLELALGVKNVTDRKYYTQAYDCEGSQVTYIYPEDGRSVSVTVRLSF